MPAPAKSPGFIVVSGPLEGSTIPIDTAELTIGRDPASGLHISDEMLSRRHCLVRRTGAGFAIVDVGSRNGTYVNDLPVTERILQTGDRVRMGSTEMVYLPDTSAPAPLPGPSVTLSEAEGRISITAELRSEEAIYLTGPRRLDRTRDQSRQAKDLAVLVQIGTRIGSARGLEEVQRPLLEAIGEALPARRAAILLVEEGGDEVASVRSWSRKPDPRGSFSVSRTVLKYVLSRRIGVLCNDPDMVVDFAKAESLVGIGVRSLICAPLIAGERLLGALYVDAADPSVRFEEPDLQLATAIAGIGAIAIENARHLEWLEGQNRRLAEETGIDHQMVGRSEPMQEIYRAIAKVAPTDATVLLLGEGGTGKELAAHAIHRNSARSERPFVAINCAALTETLLESELFGHERGAFTGAVAQKRGKIELAEKGTLFLDEIAEIAPSLQAKLLRVLQEREFERVGGTRTLRIDVRLIAATNRSLDEAIARGAFRSDLYYRLNVVSLRMPPLRERREDIPLLASFFAARFSERLERTVRGISPAARACLLRYDWPGNVRELANAIERAVIMGASDVILPEDLPETLLETAGTAGHGETGAGAAAADAEAGHYHSAVRDAKKTLISDALAKSEGNITEAAGLLGLHPNYLHRLLRNLGLRK